MARGPIPMNSEICTAQVCVSSCGSFSLSASLLLLLLLPSSVTVCLKLPILVLMLCFIMFWGGGGFLSANDM